MPGMRLWKPPGPLSESEESRWQRWRRIFDILEDRQVVPVQELIEQTGAKPHLIEQDIETLCAEGLLQRTAKGGVALEDYRPEKSLEERSIEDQVDKAHLARLAAEKYITDGMTVHIDASTTAQAIAPFIAKKRLTVVTNGLSLIADLRRFQFMGEIVCAGGHYRMKSNSVVGDSACALIAAHKADLAILSIAVISPRLQLMEAHPGEALVKRAMIQNARRTIVLAMPHKFGEASLLTVTTLADIEALISTRFPDPAFAAAAQALGVRLECPAAR